MSATRLNKYEKSQMLNRAGVLLSRLHHLNPTPEPVAALIQSDEALHNFVLEHLHPIVRNTIHDVQQVFAQGGLTADHERTIQAMVQTNVWSINLEQEFRFETDEIAPGHPGGPATARFAVRFTTAQYLVNAYRGISLDPHHPINPELRRWALGHVKVQHLIKRATQIISTVVDGCGTPGQIVRAMPAAQHLLTSEQKRTVATKGQRSPWPSGLDWNRDRLTRDIPKASKLLLQAAVLPPHRDESAAGDKTELYVEHVRGL